MAQAPLRYLGPSSGYLPRETGQVISFIRKKDRFAINNYAQLVKSPALLGVYRKIGFDQPVRVNTVDEWSWPDGQDAPSGATNKMPHQFIEFLCQRYAYPFEYGWLTVEQTSKDYKVVPAHTDMAVCQLMTNRTYRLMTLLQNAANWGANTAAAQAVDGQTGFFDTGSSDPSDPQYNFSARVVSRVGNLIQKATNSVVRWEDLRIVISPEFARRWALSSEIRDYLARSVFALPTLERGASPNGQYLLPAKFGNIPIIVEDATIVQERPNASGTEATTNRSFIKNDSTMLILSQVGGLDGQYGAPPFSTAQVYYHEREMSIEARDDSWNKKTEGRAVEITAEVLTTPVAGFLVTNCLSS